MWYEAWEAWCSYHYQEKAEIVEREQILNQVLWYNSNIKSSDQVLENKTLLDRGVVYIKDLVNRQTSDIMSSYEFECKFKYPNFLEYTKIIKAIPKEWQQQISSKIVSKDEDIEIAEQLVKSMKFVYWELMDKKIIVDNAREYWQKELKSNIEESKWEKIRERVFSVSVLTKLREFQFRLISCRLVTNVKRAKWQKDVSEKCYYCDQESETVLHIMYDCKIIQSIWQKTWKWVSYMVDKKIQLLRYETIFNECMGQYKDTVNIICLIVKQFIYAQKCLKEDISIMKVLTKIQDYRKIEKMCTIKSNKMRHYYKKWKQIE